MKSCICQKLLKYIKFFLEINKLCVTIDCTNVYFEADEFDG